MPGLGLLELVFELTGMRPGIPENPMALFRVVGPEKPTRKPRKCAKLFSTGFRNCELGIARYFLML